MYFVCKVSCILYRTDFSHSYDASWEHEIPQWAPVDQSFQMKGKSGAHAVVNAYAKHIFLQEMNEKVNRRWSVHDTWYVYRHQMWGSGKFWEFSSEWSNARVSAGYSSTVAHVRPYKEPCGVPSSSAGVKVAKCLLHFLSGMIAQDKIALQQSLVSVLPLQMTLPWH